MYHDLLEQSIPPVSPPRSLDFHVFGSNCDQVQGSQITWVEEHKGEDTFNFFSLFRNLPYQSNDFPFLNDSQSTNLGGKSNTINSFNQSPTLGNNHSNDDKYSFLCHDKFLSTSYDLSVPHEYFNSDIESTSVKEDV